MSFLSMYIIKETDFERQFFLNSKLIIKSILMKISFTVLTNCLNSEKKYSHFLCDSVLWMLNASNISCSCGIHFFVLERWLIPSMYLASPSCISSSMSVTCTLGPSLVNSLSNCNGKQYHYKYYDQQM